MPSHTFTATAEVVRYLGADPVFVDVEIDTALMNVEHVRKAVIGNPGVTEEIEVETILSPVKRTVREANAEETEKSAILWAILSAFVPFVQWYVNYFLMNDFYRHEQREDGFWEDLGRAMNKLGINFSVPRRTEAMPNRSFVLYLILTIITMGLFGVYWIYVLLKDPNEHFKYHIEAESQLLSALESVAI